MNAADVARLTGQQYLNDNLIDLGIKELVLDKKNMRVYAFSCHFYGTMMRNSNKITFQFVSRWTKRIDIFGMDVVIIVINISNLHW